MKQVVRVEKVKPGDFIEVPGRRLKPPRQGVFSMTVQKVEQIGVGYQLTFVNGNKTEWLPFDMGFQLATTDLDYVSSPASRQQSKRFKGKDIE